MDHFDSILDTIRDEMETKTRVRDETLSRSRQLIRHCANTIKAVHRGKWEEAQSGLETVRNAAQELTNGVAGYPELFHTGFTQDALKEYVEAYVTYALVRGETLPTPAELEVPGSTYLNGVAEAASEMRRKILDIIRHDHSAEAENLLDLMDTIYNGLMTFDFPDAVTGGLRRRVDSLRGVLQRTRGDLTNSLRQQKLREALSQLEARLGLLEEFQNGSDQS